MPAKCALHTWMQMCSRNSGIWCIWTWADRDLFLLSLAFSAVCNLKGLTLSSNQLTTLDKDVFKDLHKLEELDLEGNNFASIQSHVFRPLLNLETLWLDAHLMDSRDLRKRVGKYGARWRRIEYSKSVFKEKQGVSLCSVM